MLTPQYRVTPEARLDLDQIGLRIAQRNLEASDRFIDGITARFNVLAENPLLGRSRPELGENLRSFPVGDYLIIYAPTDYGVEIVRVVHGARDIGQLW